MNAKACGFHVLVIEEFRVMEEGEECNVTTRNGGDKMLNACFSSEWKYFQKWKYLNQSPI